ncbi:ATP-binding protein [Flavobacterium sp.]|uniref:ATP-binding protein n=1 Tax=Flavobacterium sp. TaxID=239 RepID=UPI00286E0769|nr:ATP-binding protein [Flavobacterium sp.]
MKKIIYIFLCSIIFTSCNQRDKSKTVENPKKTIDTLLSKSYNSKLDKNTRLVYADSLFNILNNEVNDSSTRYYYLKLSNRYFNLNESEKYVETSRRLQKLALESKDTLAIAKSLQYIGDYHYEQFNKDSAYYYYSKAEKTYGQLKNDENIDRLKLYKANILFYEKDFSGCENAIIAILKTAKKKTDTRLVYDCYITLGNALDGLNNSESALEYYNKAFTLTNELKNDSQYDLLKVQTYNYIGKTYQKQQKHKIAIDYFNKALNELKVKNTKNLSYANLINNLAYSEFKTGNQVAFKLFIEAYKIRVSLNNIPGIISSKINLAEYYLDQKDTLKAFKNGYQARNEARQNKIFEDELKALELLTQIDPKNDSFYNNRFIKLTDSLQNNERAIRNKFARIEFETDEITNQKKDIEVEKDRISFQRWIILGFGLFSISIMGLLYLTKMQHSRNKVLQFEQQQQKANEEIYQLLLEQQIKIDEARQKEKKRISQELHDGIMNKLTSTRLNLFILSKKNDEETIAKCLKHIDNIQNIEKEIRSISHNLANDVFKDKDSFKIMIESLFEVQNETSKTEFVLEMSEFINWEVVDNKTKINIYRIFQETMQNANKYANAKKCTAIIILNSDNYIEIDIVDNGVGFDLKKEKAGIGLKNIFSRVNSIGGKITIESELGKGTYINLIIPV